MAGQQQASEALWIVGGIGVIGLVAYLATRQPSGNMLQPTPAPSPATDTSSTPIATNTMSFDLTALPDPLAGTPTPSASANGAPAQFITLPSGTTVPFIAGIEYVFGSIIHFADGTAIRVGQNGVTMPYVTGNPTAQ